LPLVSTLRQAQCIASLNQPIDRELSEAETR
jgi:hypothetical protein